MATPVDITGSYIRPICLPRGESVPIDTKCVLAGFGYSKLKILPLFVNPAFITNTQILTSITPTPWM